MIKITVLILLAAAVKEDLKKREIPDFLSLCIALCSFPLFKEDFAGNIKRTVCASGILAAVVLITLITEKYKKAAVLGGGDIKLLAALALHLEASELVLLIFVSSVLLLLYICSVKLYYMSAALKNEVPFAPFIAVSFLFVKLFLDF